MRSSLLLLACLLSVGCRPSGSSANAVDGLPQGPSGSEFGDDAMDEGSLARADEVPNSEPEVPRPADTIFRDELVRATNGGRPGYLMRQLQPVAYRPRGAFGGWEVNAVFPDDPDLCRPGCDLRVGDIIVTVNGSPLEQPGQLSDLVASIEDMETLQIRLIRDGKLHERSYAIADSRD